MIGCLHCVRPRSDDARRRVGGTESAVLHLISFLISGVAEKPASTLASSSASKVISHSLDLVLCIVDRVHPAAACSFPGFNDVGVVGGRLQRDTLPNIPNTNC